MNGTAGGVGGNRSRLMPIFWLPWRRIGKTYRTALTTIAGGLVWNGPVQVTNRLRPCGNSMTRSD